MTTIAIEDSELSSEAKVMLKSMSIEPEGEA